MADSLHQKGGVDGSPLSGASGTFNTTYDYVWTVWYDFCYTYNSYKANFGKLPGQNSRFASAFTLNANKGSHGAAYNYVTYGWGNNTVTVTHDSKLPSYEGTVTLSCGVMSAETWNRKAFWDLSLSYQNKDAASNETKNISSNETEFKKWFPFALATKLKDSESDGTDSSYPTMNGTWWEVHNK